MAQSPYRGACLCGTVRFELGAEPSCLCYCHCRSCRLAAGAPLVAWGTFPLASFTLLAGALREHRSSAAVRRGFCAACGGSLTYRSEERALEIDVTLASLEAAAQLAPQAHVWVADKLPWVLLPDGLPQHHGALPP
jgi:hypothetical protein